MDKPIKASDVPLREPGPRIVTTVTCHIELRSNDRWTDSEKLIALRAMIDDRVSGVVWEEPVTREEPRPKAAKSRSTSKPRATEGERAELRARVESVVARSSKGDVLSREELALGGQWRRVTPIVRALVKRGVLVDHGTDFMRTDAPV